jgi:sphingolipid delta-4 desaturase
VGYHNEHHDFPSVPWTNLPKLREVAKEYYEPLPSHKSWPYVTYKFITDPSVGMFSRAKRAGHGEKISESTWTPTDDEVSEASDGASEDEKMGERMREATDRGYGSEPE